MYGKTDKFFLKRYHKGSGRLRVGDIVMVHPYINENGITLSESKGSFIAIITERYINWVDGERKELCTFVNGGYAAVINDYLFSRLELVTKDQCDRFWVSQQFLGWFKSIFR